MMKIMGFGNFDSSKGKKVKGNDIYVANIPKKRRYRQYMNRRGGFNRPLDFIAWDNFHQGPLIDSHFICIMLNSAQNYIL